MIRIPNDIDKYVDDIKRLDNINNNKKVVNISFTRLNVNKEGLKDTKKENRQGVFDNMLQEEIKKISSK